jgi:DNA modification methylase
MGLFDPKKLRAQSAESLKKSIKTSKGRSANVRLINGECLKELKKLPANSVDSVVTDPPAGIGFMGKEWDDFRRSRNDADAGRDNVFGRTSKTGPEYARRKRKMLWQYPVTGHGFTDGANRVESPTIGRSALNPTCVECGKRKRTWKGGPAACGCETPQFNEQSAHLDARTAFIDFVTEVMRECLRVLKPGGHALVWAIPRTSHWTAMAVEDAGFEIRDRVCHLFGSGFPKSLDVSKAIDKAAGAERETIRTREQPDIRGGSFQNRGRNGVSGNVTINDTAPSTDAAKEWSGWGTALKPAVEDWILARKPLAESTVAKNVVKHGTGALNIDGGRINIGVSEDLEKLNARSGGKRGFSQGKNTFKGGKEPPSGCDLSRGRWPANLTLDEEGAVELDKSSSEQPSRFFYVAKASKSDRLKDNNHPTVKNVELMRWLCRLITPPKGTVLDCFMGSGSTGKAAVMEGFSFIGIELEKEYFDTAEYRINKARVE